MSGGDNKKIFWTISSSYDNNREKQQCLGLYDNTSVYNGDNIYLLLYSEAVGVLPVYVGKVNINRYVDGLEYIFFNLDEQEGSVNFDENLMKKAEVRVFNKIWVELPIQTVNPGNSASQVNYGVRVANIIMDIDEWENAGSSPTGQILIIN